MLNISEQTLVMSAILDQLTAFKRDYKAMTGSEADQFKEFLDQKIKDAQSVFGKLLGVNLIETESGFKIG